MTRKYCKDHTKIENYEEAVSSPEIGKHWYNNGLIERFALEGFKPGRIR